MAKLFDLWPDNVQTLAVHEYSRHYYDAESIIGGSGAWNFLDGTSKAGSWKPVSFYVPEPLLPRPDIWKISNGALLLESRAFELLHPLIDKVGETFEQPFEGRVLYVLNVLYVADIEERQDTFSDEGLVYHVESIEHSLLRLPWGGLIAAQGVSPPALDFKYLVETHNLKGLLFREVWGSDSAEQLSL